MVKVILVSGKIPRPRAMVFMFGGMVTNMRASGLALYAMETEVTSSPMGMSLLVNMSTENLKASVSISGLMEVAILVNSKEA